MSTTKIHSDNQYPEYVATIGPQNGTLVVAPCANWASCAREPYIVCMNGWKELDEMV